MKKNITIILLAIFFTSCMTEKKVNTWLRDHPTKAAGYCADNFPPDTLSRTIVDSVDTVAYKMALGNVKTYADSLFAQLRRQRELFKATPQTPCPPPVNLDSLRRVIDAEMRKRLIPCKDTVKVVTNTVVNRAREMQLQGKLNEKDATISARDKTISEKDKTIAGLKKWPWLFWLLVALIGGYTFLKLRFKLPI